MRTRKCSEKFFSKLCEVGGTTTGQWGCHKSSGDHAPHRTWPDDAELLHSNCYC